MDSRYGERYRDLYERHWWWRARTQFIVETLCRLNLPKSIKILDIGCGDGLLFDRLAPFGEVEGVEPFVELLDPNGPHRSRIHVIPFDERFQPGKQYSLILMLDVLEHLEDAQGALRHVCHLLHPGGLLVATVPSFRALWTNHDVLNHHFTRFTKSTFRGVMNGSGLKVFEERYLYHWTYPVKLGIRLLERIRHNEPVPPSVPAPWINESLYRLSRFEQRTVSLLPIPFGSSLLVIASKADGNFHPKCR